MNALKIYKSSAGSGKTFTLVKEYLRIVLDKPSEYKHILAITFTNKATEEMKTRIVDSLVELSEGKNETLVKILQEELPKTDLKLCSKQALELILHDYSGFSVCTIDSFFQKVMRALAREIHLPLRFEVEMRKDDVIEAITEKLLDDVGKDKDLTEWLSDLIVQKLDDEKSWSIEGDIRFMANQLFREQSIVDKSLTREKIKSVLKQLRVIKKEFEEKMKRFGDDAIAVLEQHGLSAADFTQKEKGVAGYFYKISKKNNADKYSPNSYVLNAFESVDKWVSKSSPLKKEIIDLVEAKLFHHLQMTIDFFKREFPRYAASIEVLKKIYVLGIVTDLQKKLGEYREEKNSVFISDTPKILQSFISTDDAPFIFEKTGNRYHHFLIDEFQDTSDLQWKNLLPLINNSLGSGNFSMVVGDAKQSIYRWRGGNMSLLARQLREDLSHFDKIIIEEDLATNFRSKKNIIEFNNSFFKNVTATIVNEIDINENSLLELVYSEKVGQKISEKNSEGGFVKIQFLDDDKEPEPKKWKEKALEKMLEVIHQLLQQNYSMSDLSILVRNNFEGNEIADFLMEHDITKIISPDSLLLSGSVVARFLINAFHFITDQNNEVARSEVMYYYFVHVNKQKAEDLHPVFADFNNTKQRRKKTVESNTLFDTKSLDTSLFNKMLPPEFTEHLLYLAKLPVYELSEHLVRIFSLNKKPDAYVQRFQDLVLEYSTKNNSSLNGFLQWWEESETVRNCSVIIPENEDAIRIMTIHKSKGLQFPVVIMPFAEWKLKPDSRDLLWVSTDEEPFMQLGLVPVSPSARLSETSFKESYREEVAHAVIDNVNLLYVAFTRAEEQMYVFCPADKEKDLNTTSKLISRTVHSNASWQPLFSEENIFTLGEISEHQEKKKKKTEESFTVKNYPSNRWQGRISITTHSSDLVELLQPTTKSKINYGILVHKILSEINSTDEIEKVISKYYFEGLYSEEEKEKLEEEIQVLLSLPEMKSFFSDEWSVKTEREIVLPGGELLRPDRVLIKGHKAIVIDFKTGKENPSHAKQVNQYAEVLSAMNYIDIDKYLVYVNEKQVKKIT